MKVCDRNIVCVNLIIYSASGPQWVSNTLFLHLCSDTLTFWIFMLFEIFERFLSIHVI